MGKMRKEFLALLAALTLFAHAGTADAQEKELV